MGDNVKKRASNAVVKMTLGELQEAVSRELSAIIENVDHVQISAVVSAATKLAAAIDKFVASAEDTAKSAVGGPLEQLKKSLDDMVTNPVSYVRKEKKHVKLAPVKA